MIKNPSIPILLFSVIMMISFVETCTRDTRIVITSPDASVTVEFFLSEMGVPKYAISYNGGKFILPSRLGFV
ncbi:MAG: glycoside hydrolase family 97 N-terminal domain-containing protein, partial [Candidatus Marinimicrobia bacterium]|nr:glycoside hydrolase family 97 N-terminal domain-containing protein [Candidatus Neomarinimicrobiota bacterium]MCF7840711.1 glycoside hydrolase family 97 N-terminal domain-containing protein [Candidatus Neomarinimicrobiota bacterium]